VDITSPADMAAALRDVGYLPDDGIATAAFLALRMQRPRAVLTGHAHSSTSNSLSR